jgi:group I intron endonuclease
MKSGVYIITNTNSGKHYVGYSRDTDRRLKEHKTRLNSGRHENGHLQNAYNKDGAGSFTFDHLEYWDSRLLPSMENFWVMTLQTFDRKYGYNIRSTDGETGLKRISQETRVKMSIAQSGEKHSMYGKKMPAHVREKISLAVSRSKHPAAKKVVCDNTGAEWLCAADAADAIGMNVKSLRNMLTGHRKNKTSLRYA